MSQENSKNGSENGKNSTASTAEILPNYLVDRQVLTHESVIKQSGYEARDKSVLYGCRAFWHEIHFFSIFTQLFPVITWIPTYPVKKYIVGDLMAGITVAVMHIPQGMAYGLLAGVTASVGLYMAFFPTLVYFLFGTSRHISTGTFAVISLMTSGVVRSYSTLNTVNSTDIGTEDIGPVYTPMDVVTATAMAVGVIHLIMGLLRLGTLASLLSEPLVNGFTTAAAVHVVVSQLKDILGIKVYPYKGAFKIVYTLSDIFSRLDESNIAAIVFSLGIIIFMVIMNEYLKPWFSKHCPFPVPAELLAVVGGTLISRFGSIGPQYSVRLVGEIPTGLPFPKFPPVELLKTVALDAIPIAIVSYSVAMSMALIFAKKHTYEVRANQELFAFGLANIVGGCFSCIPLACSLSRSLIQEQTGGMTQIASVVSAMLILIILLWIGPFFEDLPRCVLAGIIVVALKGMFTQAKQLRKFSQQGKLEVATWIFTFLGVVLIDIDIGLLLGICISFSALYIKGWKPYSSLLGTIPGSGVYVDSTNHKNAVEIPNVKIFRYSGSINFATRQAYKKNLYAAIEIDHRKIRRASTITDKLGETKPLNAFQMLILDLSNISHVDTAGCATISEIMKEMKLLGVKLILCNPSDRVYDTVIHSTALGEGPFEIFPTIHDAVLYAKACLLS